jgi:hypothetical protein
MTQQSQAPPRQLSLIVLDLDENGDLLDPDTDKPLPPIAVESFLATHLRIPDTVTDIVVFVHGWRNTRTKAANDGQRFFADLETTYQAHHSATPLSIPGSATM